MRLSSSITQLLLSLLLSTKISPSTATTSTSTSFPLDPGFPIQLIVSTALNISTHSWEFGTATQALLELYDPDLSIFGSSPFTASKRIPNASTLPQALSYAAEKIVFGTGPNALADGDGAVGDPASLGIGAWLLGKKDGYEQFKDGAIETYGYVTGSAPRAWNNAISHRAYYVEIWADFVSMAPPFLAYYAADTANITGLQEAVYQCSAYRQILHYNTSSLDATFTGLWDHILGPTYNVDAGLWSTGNAWAASGITRVLATVIKAPQIKGSTHNETLSIAQWRESAKGELTTLVKEIIDAVIDSGEASYENGLVRNYFNNPTIFGETSGSSLFAAVIYRLVVLLPNVFGKSSPAGKKYINWAEGIRKTLGGTFVAPDGTNMTLVDRTNGTVRPAVNPLGWGDTAPFMTGSPEGQSMVTMLYAAWRDCRLAKKC
ncbi:hypothetical protein H0H93_003040 [Arthromyces matolae]|nr:hypothetical protein H0H93_003040 [Arthromyces matolae]